MLYGFSIVSNEFSGKRKCRLALPYKILQK